MRCLTISLFCALALSVGAQAQHAATPEPPVRYDTDVLSPAFHESRRQAVKEALPTNAVALFFSAPERTRENDVQFEYRQDSDLYYLTGTHEPETVLLLAPGGLDVDGETVTELLLVPPRTPYSDVWLGRRYGPERARQELGIQKVVSNERYEEILTPLLASDSLRFHVLPLPRGVDEDGELAHQVAFFKERARPLENGGNSVTQRLVSMMLTLDDPALFGRMQQMLTRQANPASLSDSLLRGAYDAFTEVASYDGWQAWREEHLAGRPDGVLLRRVMDGLRAIKTEEELRLLQRAIDITTAAHREAMKSIAPGMHEYEVEALIEYVFRRNGAEDPGFPSIIGSGENSVILHYDANRRRMEAADVVVMDIGAEYHGYSADVTRTVPVDGSFSPEQKQIYELVLQAQEAGVKAARAGSPFQAPDQAARQVVAQGLRRLGLIQRDEDVHNFFMHGTSHYLGLYVHDVGDYGMLAPGTVITVEPGIYISPSPGVDPKWWNIGVRIEDDVLITEGDPVVMSAAAPRTVAEIEALMQETGLGNDPAGLVEAGAPAEPARGTR